MFAVFLMTMLGLEGPAKQGPVALVIAVKGPVEVKSDEGGAVRARVQNLLYAGDRVSVPADGALVLVILDTGDKLRVRPGRGATIGPKGATPVDAVDPSPPLNPAVVRAFRVVRPLAPGGRSPATGVLRSDDGPIAIPDVTPIRGATVISDRPAFTWVLQPDVTTYRVRLFVGALGASRVLWSAETSKPRLDYPAERAPLRRACKYYWDVSDQDGRTIVGSEFLVASADESENLAEVVKLTRSGDASDVVLAAVTLTAYGVYEDAIRAAERLTVLLPDEPVVRQSLDELRRRAGKAVPAH